MLSCQSTLELKKEDGEGLGQSGQAVDIAQTWRATRYIVKDKTNNNSAQVLLQQQTTHSHSGERLSRTTVWQEQTPGEQPVHLSSHLSSSSIPHMAASASVDLEKDGRRRVQQTSEKKNEKTLLTN